MILQELQTKHNKLLNDEAELRRQIQELEDQLFEVQNEIEGLKSETAKLIIAKNRSNPTEDFWKWLLTNENDCQYKYDFIRDFLPKGFFSNGYFGYSNQRLLGVFVKRDTTDTELKEMAKWLNYFTDFILQPQSMEDFVDWYEGHSVVIFDMMEYTRSAHGSFYLVYDDTDEKWVIEKLVRGHRIILNSFDDSLKAVQFIRERCYYE